MGFLSACLASISSKQLGSKVKHAVDNPTYMESTDRHAQSKEVFSKAFENMHSQNNFRKPADFIYLLYISYIIFALYFIYLL